MSNPLEKIIDLVKKTGDNCVVLDYQGNPTYVIMAFNNYQRLVAGQSEVSGLTEDQLLDKINRDIANWKATQSTLESDNWQSFESAVSDIKGSAPASAVDQNPLNQANNNQNSAATDEKYYFEPID